MLHTIHTKRLGFKFRSVDEIFWWNWIQLGEEVIDVACGWRHVIALSSDSEHPVHTWGTDKAGCLGNLTTLIYIARLNTISCLSFITNKLFLRIIWINTNFKICYFLLLFYDEYEHRSQHETIWVNVLVNLNIFEMGKILKYCYLIVLPQFES